MFTLFILNSAPYDGERSYQALRLATALSGSGTTVRVFLMGDGVNCAVSGAVPPENIAFNVEWMLQRLLAVDANVAACGTCMDARAIADAQLIEGVRRSTLDELARWTQRSERVLVF